MNDGTSTTGLRRGLVSDEDQTESSLLRRTLTSQSHNGDLAGSGSQVPTYEEIVARRGALKWLPSHASNNDMVYGMWWFVAGSVLATLMPMSPLATYEEMHPNSIHNPNLDEEAHLITYILLIICGIFYTVGSYALKRAVDEPQQRPMFSGCSCCVSLSDELFGSICFLLGTAMAVPIAINLIVLDSTAMQYYVALVFSLFACAVCIVFCYSCFPSRVSSGRDLVRPFIVHYCCCCCCGGGGGEGGGSKHLANDLLISAWSFLVGCAAVALLSFGLFVRALLIQDINSLFDFGIGTIDMVLFTMGSAYFVAGSYPSPSPSPLSLSLFFFFFAAAAAAGGRAGRQRGKGWQQQPR